MRKKTLGKTNLHVSAVGFGGIPIQRLSEDDAVAVIRHALDLGVTFIDTAAGYGDSQLKIGKAIEGRRDGLVLATKTPAATREDAAADIERSLRELRTDHIDLIQFHGVSDKAKWARIDGPGGALEAMLDARDKGLVGHVGFTSHSREMALELVDEEVFETVQFPFNLVTSEPAADLIPKAIERGLGFIAMKPLCGGQYDNARLAFKYLNAFPEVVPIPGIEKAWEIEEIAAIVDSGKLLSGAEKAEAEKIAADLGKLFCRRCGYCMPCAEGVPITTAMIFDSMVKRMPAEDMVGIARNLLAKADDCVECGKCEERCPYDLPIIESVRAAARNARAIVGES